MSRRKPSQGVPEVDPYAEREAQNYDNPIPSREYILDVLEAHGAPASPGKVAALLEVEGEDQVEAVRRRLRAMVRDGQLLRNRRDGYFPIHHADLVVGRVLGHPDGFGFLKPDDGSDDLFLSPREMRSLFPEDRVAARVTGLDRRGRKEGGVVEVLERNTHEVVGRYQEEQGISVVIPDNRRIAKEILIPSEERWEAKPGEIVVAEIMQQPGPHQPPIGRIVSILGDHMDAGMEIEVAIRAHNIPDEWPEEVLEESQVFSEEVPEAAKEGRTDLRDLPLVTIDGEDARDFDDAVYCQRTGKGWRLIVAIADVSAYVEPGSALDKEAVERGNSVYFPELVIPMLPEVLSNGLCSLNPEVDRLCLACEMFVNEEGAVYRSRFLNGVMRSHARLTYNEVGDILGGGGRRLVGKRVRKEVKPLVPHLQTLHELYKVLLKTRHRRGALEFESTETRIVFGEDRKIERLEPVVRNDAHRLIEECMLAANVTAARFLERKRLPLPYRRHDGPSDEKLAALRTLLGELGLSLGGGEKPSPLDYANLLSAVEGRPDAHMIETVLLRSLSQAVYTPDSGGHFGLAYDAYTHFTSPIRRYPDLVVHRTIRFALTGQPREKAPYSHQDLVSLGEHCSMTERRADEATRDAVSWLKCEYMLDKVGSEYTGLITGVTSFGLFVELDDIHVEGLVHITNLPRDYYQFDPKGHRLTGERAGKVFRLADRVRIRVDRVDLDDRKIDFGLLAHGHGKRLVPVEDSAPESKSSRKKKKPTGRGRRH